MRPMSCQALQGLRIPLLMIMQVLNAGFDRLWENNNKGVRILLKSAFVGVHDIHSCRRKPH